MMTARTPLAAAVYLLISLHLPLTVVALCGFDSRQVISINSTLAIAICSPRVARIFRIPESKSSITAASQLRKRTSLAVQPGYADACCDVPYKVTEDDNFTTIDTGYLRIEVSKSSENIISFCSSVSGELATAETSSSFTPIPNTTFHENSQSWGLSKNEGFYGGGQYVNGHVNYAAAPLLMIQFNTEAVVPFFLSSKGYGILWDHYGISKLNPPSQDNEIVLDGGVALWSPPSSGDYWFYVQTCQDETQFGARGKSFTLYLDEKLVCKHRLVNMPCAVSCKLHGIFHDEYDYKVHLDTDVEQPRLFFTSISDTNTTTLTSQYANYIDYYFVIGNETENTAPEHHGNHLLDSVIGSYRDITGTAPLYPKKAYGFWQCKERYHNQTELLAAANKFRELGIPVDNIVQDWLYWGDSGWGPVWDTKKYPDPNGMVDELHKLDFNFMVSVWSQFDVKTKFYKEMKDRGLLIEGSTYMDAWNPEAQSLFFDYSTSAHFSIGVDSLWLDATEPEDNPHKDKHIYLGEANEYWNTYSLQVSKSIYNGLKDLRDNRRVFSLTRSSFAGQQRFGAALWSGDITSSWDSLRRQIAMSINYQLSGIPYWSEDIGGFRRADDQYDSPDYARLLKRWFQFGVFTSIMRVHGTSSNTELWNYGNETMNDILAGSINFRYRLIDYIYSNFAKAEREHYTVQRGLILDFPEDQSVYSISDQFMFGYSFLVAPIYSPADSRNVYLPALGSGGGCWRNFYNGNEVPPGDHATHGVSITEMPLFVRSSILVLSPLRQHVFELVEEDALEVRIYDGANSSLLIYKDRGTNAASDRAYCEIRFAWNDVASSLTIADLGGQQCGDIFTPVSMNITLVTPGHGVGVKPCSDPDVSLVYDGSKQVVPLGPTAFAAELV